MIFHQRGARFNPEPVSQILKHSIVSLICSAQSRTTDASDYCKKFSNDWHMKPTMIFFLKKLPQLLPVTIVKPVKTMDKFSKATNEKAGSTRAQTPHWQNKCLLLLWHIQFCDILRHMPNTSSSQSDNCKTTRQNFFKSPKIL